jgi:Zn-dependent metalloprotease
MPPEPPATACFPQSVHRSAARAVADVAAISALQNGAAKRFTVFADETTGTVRSLAYGRTRSYGADPVAAAKAFLRDAGTLFGADADTDTLSVVESRPTAFGNLVSLQQTVGGVPILGRQVALNLTDAGEVWAAENTTAPLASVDTNPTVSELSAAGMAKGRIVRGPSLAIDPLAPEPRLVWIVISAEGPGRTIRSVMDAHSGEVIIRENIAEAATTGHGMVYPDNPVSTPTLTTEDLPWLSGGGALTGLYTTIYDGYPGVQDVNEPTFVYNYSPGDVRLTEAEAYYGITGIHDFFKGHFNFTGRDSPSMPGYIHIDGLNNAYFDPTMGSGAMVFGAYSGIDYALDSSVLSHEFTHSVVDKVAPAFADAYDYYHEQGGMNEGLADYFACSKLNNPIIGAYALQDGGQRDLRDRYHFPEDLPLMDYDSTNKVYFQTFPEVHQTGSTWGPVCWDLHQALGQTTADALIFKALSSFTATTRMQSAMAAIIAADATLNAGANAGTIRQVFNARGIYETAYPVDYLLPTSFYSSTGASKVYTGFADPYNGYFYETDTSYYYPLGLFPAYAADRWYGLFGYTTDSTIASVFVVLKDPSSGKVVAYSGNSTSSMTGVTSSGNKTYKRIATMYKFPSSLVPAGSKYYDARLYIRCYTQTTATVNANFSGTTPKSESPVTGTVYKARIVKVRPGDINADGTINMRDAIIALRWVRGLDLITGFEFNQADIVAPTGTLDISDVKQMLKVAAGLA